MKFPMWGALVAKSGKHSLTLHWFVEDGRTICGVKNDDWIRETDGFRCKNCLRERRKEEVTYQK